MNFSNDIKREIFERGFNSIGEKRAYLAGFLRATAFIVRDKLGYGFQFSSENDEAIEFFLKLFFETYEYFLQLSEVDEDKLNKVERKTYSLTGERALNALSDLNIFSKRGKSFSLNYALEGEFFVEDKLKSAFIKGMFVGSGSCTLPNRDKGQNRLTGYHLEFIFYNYEASLGFGSLLAGLGLIPKTVKRKNSYVLYIKSSEEIKDLLAYMGLSRCVLSLTELMVEKEASNNVNRQVNCDIGNIGRQQLAAEKQINAIKNIDMIVGLNSLPENLMETAVMRLNHPDDNLNELSLKLGITKSCLNHRLRKITEISDNLTV